MRLLVTGASGQLGAYLLQALQGTGHEVTAWSGPQSQATSLFGCHLQPFDLADRDVTAEAFRRCRPQVVLHAAALATVAACCAHPDQALRVNVATTDHLAELVAASQSRLLFVSTDLVFAGEEGNYCEGDPPSPLSVYGRTKLQAEQGVLTNPRSAVVRLSLLFGSTLIGRSTFFDNMLTALHGQRPLTLFDDEWRTPLSLLSAARALLALVDSDFSGLLHVGGPERLSRLEMGLRLAQLLDRDPAPLVAGRRDQAPAPEPRPRDTSLNSSRWRSSFPQLPWLGYEESLREILPCTG